MVKRVKVEGQIYQFPDDASDDEISSTLQGMFPAQQDNTKDADYDPFTGSSRNLKDVAGDLVQGLANARMQGDKFIAPIADPIRKMIPEKYRFAPALKPHEFEGKNPDEMTQALTQYGLPLVAGGGDALKTALLAGLYEGTQAEPGQRTKGAAEGVLSAGLLPILGRQAGPLIGMAGKIKNYFHPEKEARAFLKSLHGGTSQENIDTLAKRLAFANQSAEREALIPKEKLLSTEAKTPILPPQTKGSYLSTAEVTEPYSKSGKLIELHDKYEASPTFENSDQLISAIKKQERKYAGTKEDAGIKKLEDLKRNREALEKDQEAFFKTLPPEKQNLYKEFREKYRANKEKYENKKSPILSRLASEEPGGVKSKNVRNQFSGNLRENVMQALEDIGPSGEQNILYNELAGLKPGDITGLQQKLAELEQTGGMQRYTQPHKELAENLAKRLKHRRYAVGSGLGLTGALAAAGGFPKTGGALGTGAALTAAGGASLGPKLLKMLAKGLKP